MKTMVPREEFDRQVLAIVQDAMGEKIRVTPDTRFIEDLDTDSLTMVRLAALFQGKLKLALAAEDIDRIQTVRDLAEALHTHGQPVEAEE